MATPRPRVLSEEQVGQFKLNGFLTVHDVLSAEEVEALAAHTDLIAAGKAAHIPQTSIQLEKVFREGERDVTDQELNECANAHTPAVAPRPSCRCANCTIWPSMTS